MKIGGKIMAGLLCVWTAAAAFGEPAAGTSLRRFGIFIGSNNGGRNRGTLRYAVSDARTVSRVFAQMGGIGGEDNLLLIEPTVGDINRRIDALGLEAARARETNRRTEIVFYYSGHSDEEGLLLNRERYEYRELRDRINRLPADMRIVILDSCSSGVFTRLKGGTKTQPFLFDSSLSAEGYAFLTSSSADEASQESDKIESSYFTHSLVAGLRGAADMVGDGRVTLNELYRFAYAETLAQTETSVFGAQHPSYDIQVSGTGDVVLTDIKETSASLVIPGEMTGRFSIRDASDHLVAEITKTAARPMELGLESGAYRVSLQREDGFYRAEFTVAEGERRVLAEGDFSPAAPSPARPRGEAEGEEAEEEEAEEEPPRWEPVSLHLLSGWDFFGDKEKFRAGTPRTVNNLIFGVLGARGYELEGLGIAGFWLFHAGPVYGLEVSGALNMSLSSMTSLGVAGLANGAGDRMAGLQAAGLANMAGGMMYGLQAASLANLAGGAMMGLQTAGLANAAGGMMYGLQAASLANLAGGPMYGLQMAGIANVAGGWAAGIQTAGIVNVAGASMTGLQMAGIVNVAGGPARGAQFAGILNYAGGPFWGLQTGIVNRLGSGEGAALQIGVVNISENEKAIPLGLVNVVKNGLIHPAVYIDDLGIMNASFRSGSRYVYSIASVGSGLADYGDLFITRMGFGFELPLKPLFFNFDVTAGSLVTFGSFGKTGDDDRDGSSSLDLQARLTVGCKIFEHLGIFAGVSYAWTYLGENSPVLSPSIVKLIPGELDSRNRQRIGFFAGLQF